MFSAAADQGDNESEIIKEIGNMAMPKKRSRTITIDGISYRWQLRGRPTYMQGIGASNLSVAVEQVTEQGGVTTLVIDTAALHPSNWVEKSEASVTPVTVAIYIRQALQQGWKPAQRGGTFTLTGNEELVQPTETPVPEPRGRF